MSEGNETLPEAAPNEIGFVALKISRLSKDRFDNMPGWWQIERLERAEMLLRELARFRNRENTAYATQAPKWFERIERLIECNEHCELDRKGLCKHGRPPTAPERWPDFDGNWYGILKDLVHILRTNGFTLIAGHEEQEHE